MTGNEIKKVQPQTTQQAPGAAQAPAAQQAQNTQKATVNKTLFAGSIGNFESQDCTINSEKEKWLYKRVENLANKANAGEINELAGLTGTAFTNKLEALEKKYKIVVPVEPAAPKASVKQADKNAAKLDPAKTQAQTSKELPAGHQIGPDGVPNSLAAIEANKNQKQTEQQEAKANMSAKEKYNQKIKDMADQIAADFQFNNNSSRDYQVVQGDCLWTIAITALNEAGITKPTFEQIDNCIAQIVAANRSSDQRIYTKLGTYTGMTIKIGYNGDATVEKDPNAPAAEAGTNTLDKGAPVAVDPSTLTQDKEDPNLLVDKNGQKYNKDGQPVDGKGHVITPQQNEQAPQAEGVEGVRTANGIKEYKKAEGITGFTEKTDAKPADEVGVTLEDKEGLKKYTKGDGEEAVEKYVYTYSPEGGKPVTIEGTTAADIKTKIEQFRNAKAELEKTIPTDDAEKNEQFTANEAAIAALDEMGLESVKEYANSKLENIDPTVAAHEKNNTILSGNLTLVKGLVCDDNGTVNTNKVAALVKDNPTAFANLGKLLNAIVEKEKNNGLLTLDEQALKSILLEVQKLEGTAQTSDEDNHAFTQKMNADGSVFFEGTVEIGGKEVSFKASTKENLEKLLDDIDAAGEDTAKLKEVLNKYSGGAVAPTEEAKEEKAEPETQPNYDDEKKYTPETVTITDVKYTDPTDKTEKTAEGYTVTKYTNKENNEDVAYKLEINGATYYLKSEDEVKTKIKDVLEGKVENTAPKEEPKEEAPAFQATDVSDTNTWTKSEESQDKISVEIEGSSTVEYEVNKYTKNDGETVLFQAVKDGVVVAEANNIDGLRTAVTAATQITPTPEVKEEAPVAEIDTELSKSLAENLNVFGLNAKEAIAFINTATLDDIYAIDITQFSEDVAEGALEGTKSPQQQVQDAINARTKAIMEDETLKADPRNAKYLEGIKEVDITGTESLARQFDKKPEEVDISNIDVENKDNGYTAGTAETYKYNNYDEDFEWTLTPYTKEGSPEIWVGKRTAGSDELTVQAGSKDELIAKIKDKDATIKWGAQDPSGASCGYTKSDDKTITILNENGEYKQMTYAQYTKGDNVVWGAGLSEGGFEFTATSEEALLKQIEKGFGRITNLEVAPDSELDDAKATRQAANLDKLWERYDAIMADENATEDDVLALITDLKADNNVNLNDPRAKDLVHKLILTRDAEVLSALIGQDTRDESNKSGERGSVLFNNDPVAVKTLAAAYKEIRNKEKAGEELTPDEIRFKQEVKANGVCQLGADIETTPIDDTNSNVYGINFDGDGNLAAFYNVKSDDDDRGGAFTANNPALLKQFIEEVDTSEADNQDIASKYLDDPRVNADKSFLASLAANICTLEINDDNKVKLMGLEGCDAEVLSYVQELESDATDEQKEAYAKAYVKKALAIYDPANTELVRDAEYVDDIIERIDSLGFVPKLKADGTFETDDKGNIVMEANDDTKKLVFRYKILGQYFNTRVDDKSGEVLECSLKEFNRNFTYEEMAGLTNVVDTHEGSALADLLEVDNLKAGTYTEAILDIEPRDYNGDGNTADTIQERLEHLVGKITTKEDALKFIKETFPMIDKAAGKIPFDKVLEKCDNTDEAKAELWKYFTSSSSINDTNKETMFDYAVDENALRKGITPEHIVSALKQYFDVDVHDDPANPKATAAFKAAVAACKKENIYALIDLSNIPKQNDLRALVQNKVKELIPQITDSSVLKYIIDKRGVEYAENILSIPASNVTGYYKDDISKYIKKNFRYLNNHVISLAYKNGWLTPVEKDQNKIDAGKAFYGYLDGSGTEDKFFEATKALNEKDSGEYDTDDMTDRYDGFMEAAKAENDNKGFIHRMQDDGINKVMINRHIKGIMREAVALGLKESEELKDLVAFFNKNKSVDIDKQSGDDYITKVFTKSEHDKVDRSSDFGALFDGDFDDAEYTEDQAKKLDTLLSALVTKIKVCRGKLIIEPPAKQQ